MTNTLIGTNGSSYAITDSTRVITISGFDSFTKDNLLYVYNVTQGLLYFAPVERTPSLDLVTVSGGNVITIDGSFAVMPSTDVLHIQISTGDIAYDPNLDGYKHTVLNPEYAYYTSVEHVLQLSNVAIGSYREEILMDSYRYLALQLDGSGGVTFTIWATMDSGATTASDSGWYDVSTSVLGAASLVDSAGVFFIDNPQMPLKYMIKYVTSDASNAVDAWIRRY